MKKILSEIEAMASSCFLICLYFPRAAPLALYFSLYIELISKNILDGLPIHVLNLRNDETCSNSCYDSSFFVCISLSNVAMLHSRFHLPRLVFIYMSDVLMTHSSIRANLSQLSYLQLISLRLWPYQVLQ